MAEMLHHDSSGSTVSSNSSSLPITPTSSTLSDGETLPPILPAPLLDETHQSPPALPTLNITAISLSKSEANISNLAKSFGATSPAIRPSPSLSTLQRKPEGAAHKDPTSFGLHGRRRSNSLSEKAPPTVIKDNSSKVAPLAERRRSETSRYLGTDDFKSAFAINLLKLKEREKVDGEPALLPSDVTPKTSDMGSNLLPITNSQLKLLDRHNSGIRPTETQDVPLHKDFSAVTIHTAASHLVNLPAEELSSQIERHFNRHKLDRMEDELEARNEVISILAHQLSNQLEVNDKLLHELAALRAAYASLQSSCSDYADELELLKRRSRAAETAREVERSRRESEDKIRGLGQLVHDSKRTFCRLQAEVLHHGKRRSLQDYNPLEHPRRSSSYTLTAAATTGGPSPPRRNSSYILGGELAGALSSTVAKRSTLLVLSSENSNGGPSSALASLTSQFARVQNNSAEWKLPASPSLNKPERPPKSTARSHTASPAAFKSTRSHPQASLVAPPASRSDSGTQTPDIFETEELQKLRQRCARLELELNESEDSRMASQDALDALRQFISSQPEADLSSIKLPPLPTDIGREDNSEEAIGSRWHISNLMSRTNYVKASATGPSSPFLKSPSMHGSPAFVNAFSGFNLWGRSPVLG